MRSSRCGKVYDNGRLRCAGAVEVCRLGPSMTAPALRFIESWNDEDAYERFGSAGIGGPESLVAQITQRRRPALIAVDGDGVVALLDHVEADGATHIGIVVHPRFRRMSIGTTLVRSLLCSRSVTRPIVAECGNGNEAAVALLRACRFGRVKGDRYQTTWCHA